MELFHGPENLKLLPERVMILAITAFCARLFPSSQLGAALRGSSLALQPTAFRNINGVQI